MGIPSPGLAGFQRRLALAWGGSGPCGGGNAAPPPPQAERTTAQIAVPISWHSLVFIEKPPHAPDSARKAWKSPNALESPNPKSCLPKVSGPFPHELGAGFHLSVTLWRRIVPYLPPLNMG
jgi:hypothetical protein